MDPPWIQIGMLWCGRMPIGLRADQLYRVSATDYWRADGYSHPIPDAQQVKPSQDGYAWVLRHRYYGEGSQSGHPYCAFAPMAFSNGASSIRPLSERPT